MVAKAPSDSLVAARQVVRVDILLDWMCESSRIRECLEESVDLKGIQKVL